MKLSDELPEFIKRLTPLKEAIQEHSRVLKESGNYKDFQTRLAFDCLHKVYSSNEVCNWYKLYNCNDTHIETLAKKAVKEVLKTS